MAIETIRIDGNCPSSKNSKQITRSGFIVHSKQCQVYYKATKLEWIEGAASFKEMFKNETKPYYVGFYYVRKSKHKFDYINPNQTTLDLMVKYGWIEDDNADEIRPVFLGFHHDKDDPCTYITTIEPAMKKQYEKIDKQFKDKKNVRQNKKKTEPVMEMAK